MAVSKLNLSILFKTLSFVIVLFIVAFSNTVLIIAKEVFNIGVYNWKNYEAIFSTLPFALMATIFLVDAFNLLEFRYKSTMAIFRRTLYFSVILTLFSTTIAFFFRQFSFPRSAIVLGFSIQFLLTFVWSLIAKYLFDRKADKRTLLVVYQNEQNVDSTLKNIAQTKDQFGYTIIKPFHFFNLTDLLKAIEPFTDVLIEKDLDHSLRNEIVLQTKKYNGYVFVVPGLYELSLKSAENLQINDIMLMGVHHNELSLEQRILKRVFDIAVSLLALILTSPIFIVVALLVKATSPGPVIFKQERVTRGFKRFNIYKFRTMYQDAEAKTGPVIAGENDHRITKVGKVLRRFRIDELPQFLNVLSGDMSVVGPRAERLVFVEHFLKDVNGYELRYKMKAGITGLAQIFGNYDSTAENKLRFDLAYINDYSLLSDLRLILLTVKKLFVF